MHSKSIKICSKKPPWILNKGNKQRIFRFYSERFGTGLQKWMVTPNPGWLSTKRVPPSSILQRDKKTLAHENRFILSNPGLSGEYHSPCLLGSPKKQEMPKEAILDKNSNRESHERMFRFYWYRFGIGLPNVNGRPQICLQGLPVTCANKKIKKACPFELDRLAQSILKPSKAEDNFL